MNLRVKLFGVDDFAGVLLLHIGGYRQIVVILLDFGILRQMCKTLLVLT